MATKLVVIDVREDYVKLPNGKRIPRKNIVSIDYDNGIVVYIDRDGTIKTEKIR